MLVPRTAGALSAFGGQHSDIITESGRTVFSSSEDFAYAEVDSAFAEIEQALTEFAQTLTEGGERESRIDWFVEARYAYQAWTLEVALPKGAPRDDDGVRKFVKDFDELHERVFAVHEPGQAVEILYCRGRLVGDPAEAAPARPRRRAGRCERRRAAQRLLPRARAGRDPDHGRRRARAGRQDRGARADRRADDDGRRPAGVLVDRNRPR